MEPRHRRNLTALIRHGLELNWLVEHDWTVQDRFTWLVQNEDGHWTSPVGMPRVPLTFSLLAHRPVEGSRGADTRGVEPQPPPVVP